MMLDTNIRPWRETADEWNYCRIPPAFLRTVTIPVINHPLSSLVLVVFISPEIQGLHTKLVSLSATRCRRPCRRGILSGWSHLLLLSCLAFGMYYYLIFAVRFNWLLKQHQAVVPPFTPIEDVGDPRSSPMTTTTATARFSERQHLLRFMLIVLSDTQNSWPVSKQNRPLFPMTTTTMMLSFLEEVKWMWHPLSSLYQHWHKFWYNAAMSSCHPLWPSFRSWSTFIAPCPRMQSSHKLD